MQSYRSIPMNNVFKGRKLGYDKIKDDVSREIEISARISEISNSEKTKTLGAPLCP